MDMLHAAVNSQDVKNGLDSWPPADSRRTLVLINNVKLQGGGGEKGCHFYQTARRGRRQQQKRSHSAEKEEAQSTYSLNSIQQSEFLPCNVLFLIVLNANWLSIDSVM